MRTRGPLCGIAAAIVAVPALVHGLWTDRWAPSPRLARAVAQLDRIPMDIGDWRGEELPLDPRQFQQTGAAGYVMRVYEDRATKERLSVLLLCGRPGPVSVHTPDVCYAAIGFDSGTPRAVAVPAGSGSGPGAEFLAADFRKAEAVPPSSLRIFWAWRTQAGWSASGNPRVAFAREPVLYKLYVVRDLPAGPAPPLDDDPALQFIPRLLREIDRTLSGADPGGAAPDGGAAT